MLWPWRARGAGLLAALMLAGCANVGAPSGPQLSCVAPCAREVAHDPPYAWEPSVGVDPNDARHIVVAMSLRDPPESTAFATFGIVVHTTFDAGATWSTVKLQPKDPDGTPANTADPEVVILDDSIVLVAHLPAKAAGAVPGMASSGYSLVVSRSHDGGRTFPEDVVVAAGHGAAFSESTGTTSVGAGFVAHDRETLTVGPDGDVYLTWRVLSQTSPEPMSSTLAWSRSTDRGATWSTPKAITASSYPLLDANGIVVAGDGAWLVPVGGWTTSTDDANAEFHEEIARSTDDGASWNVTELGFGGRFSVVSASGHVVAFAWGARVPGSPGHVEQPTLRISRDDARTFDAPVTIDRSTGDGWAIPMTVPGSITYWITPAAGSHELRARGIVDGMLTPPVTLASNVHRSPEDLGDYFGLAPTPHGAIAVWPDDDTTPRAMMSQLHLS